MHEKLFHRGNYPLHILADFGLTEQMIYDLPDFVHDTLENGGKSPLLPISIQQPFGETHLYAKFSLVETEHGMDVLFYPKLKNMDLDQFTASEKDLLLVGKVIVADVNEGNQEETRRIKAFVQIDKDTNDVVYTPTQVIGRNLAAIAGEYDIDGDQLQKFWNGDLVTVTESNEQGNEEPVTIGVDLFSDKGVVVVPGSAEHWERTVRKTMPQYSFGNDGCWVNRNGNLRYVPEDEFTQELWDVLQLNAKKNDIPSIPMHHETEEEYEQEQTRQLTR